MKILQPKNNQLLPILMSLLLVLGWEGLLICHQYYNYTNKLLELVINVYGAFVATLIGVYISVYYSNKQSKDAEGITHKKIMLGS